MELARTVQEVPETVGTEWIKLGTGVATVLRTNVLATHVVWSRLSGKVGVALSEADLATMLARQSHRSQLAEGYVVVDLRTFDQDSLFQDQLDSLEWLTPSGKEPESAFPDCF